MRALQPLPAFVSCDAQREAVFGAQLFQLGEHTGCDYGSAFGVEGVHHCGLQLEFLLDGVGEEVCVYKDGVGGDEGGVVLEEEGGLCVRGVRWVRERGEEEWRY